MQIAAASQRRAEALETKLIASPMARPELIAAPRQLARRIMTRIVRGAARIVRRLLHVQKSIAATAIVYRRTCAIVRRRAQQLTPIELGRRREPTPILAAPGLKLAQTMMSIVVPSSLETAVMRIGLRTHGLEQLHLIAIARQTLRVRLVG